MLENDFVDDLPSYATCSHCQLTINAPVWRVSRFDASDWLAVNVVACPKCRNVIVGAAGTSMPAMAEAKAIRLRFLRDASLTIKKDNF
ncbi:MAG: hypothetical protein I4O49_10595 [Janthinobacterium lividum]|nr:hypothetical protein [Janthinobacterium lividum]